MLWEVGNLDKATRYRLHFDRITDVYISQNFIILKGDKLCFNLHYVTIDSVLAMDSYKLQGNPSMKDGHGFIA